MPKIEKYASGKYSTRIYVNGKRVRITGDTSAEVKQEAHKVALNGKNIQKGKITLGECIDQYIALQEPVLSPTTIRSYVGIRRNYFKSIMNCQIDTISPTMLQNAINELVGVISPKTIRNAIGLVSSSLKQYDIPLPKHHLPQKEKTDIHIPTQEEIEKLIASSNGDLQVAIILGAFLGLRRGEICALTPQDFDGTTLAINKDLVLTRNGEWIVKPPKTTDSKRTLIVPDNIKDKIVLPVNLKPNYITQKFERKCKRLGINIRFHDLRHYFVSVMVANNVPNLYIRSYTGHHSDNMINKTYAHLIKDKQKEIAKSMPKFFGTKMGQ